MFLCNGKKFKTLDQAVLYANQYHAKTGVILGIEGV